MIPMLRVEVKNDRPLICARELYEALGIKTQYSVWIDRIISLGFVSGQDFYPKMNKSTGGRCSVDHYITVDMAKHICMLLRNEKGKLYRQYFLELEKAWNQPEQVMARALQLANTQIAKLQEQCTELGDQLIKHQMLLEDMAPKAAYLDLIMNSPSSVLVTQIAKDYGYSAVSFNRLLHDMRIQYKVNDQWVLYADYAGKGYVQSRTIYMYPNRTGPVVRIQTEWTQKGRRFLYEFLKEQGILPLIEKEVDKCRKR